MVQHWMLPRRSGFHGCLHPDSHKCRQSSQCSEHEKVHRWCGPLGHLFTAYDSIPPVVASSRGLWIGVWLLLSKPYQPQEMHGADKHVHIHTHTSNCNTALLLREVPKLEHNWISRSRGCCGPAWVTLNSASVPTLYLQLYIICMQVLKQMGYNIIDHSTLLHSIVPEIQSFTLNFGYQLKL